MYVFWLYVHPMYAVVGVENQLAQNGGPVLVTQSTRFNVDFTSGIPASLGFPGGLVWCVEHVSTTEFNEINGISVLHCTWS